jgi:dTDP-4-dehydrorhamnose reductase
MQITKNTRIYIAGCGGMLGEAVYGTFSPIAQVKASDLDVNEPWLSAGDVRSYPAMENEVASFSPNVVINLAALTDMEYCELNPAEAWKTNTLGAENMALIAKKFGATYVYICTAGIFDGRQDYYSDFDSPNPLSYYAKSKYAGEIFTREYMDKFFVIRAGWMMGGGPRKDKKFINKIYKQIVAGEKQLHVVNDKAGTPTYTWDFAAGIRRLLESEMYGVYNQVCRGSTTRADVAREFVKLLNVDVGIKEVSSDFFSVEYFAPRPASEMLLTTKLDARGLNVMRDWRECLRDYVAVFAEDYKRGSAGRV